MGRVYLAEHVFSKRLRAVKVLSEELAQHKDVVNRFINEARAASVVHHRNLIEVVDIAPASDTGTSYMVLEYLEGGTLARFIGSHGGPLAYDLIVRLLGQVANALHELHKHSIIHRDLKAENVFLVSRDGDPHRPIVLDLGVASLGEGLSEGPRTRRGMVLGTPCAMAPEQLLGEGVGPESDVYALGVLLYHMSTGGYWPYQKQGESYEAYTSLPTAELYRRQMTEPPVDPRVHHPGMRDAWARVIFSWLDPDRTTRTSNAKDAAVELAKAMPVDDEIKDGFHILQEYASELLAVDYERETIRSPAVTVALTGTGTGRYEWGEKLGAGGMAEVYAGTEIGEQGIERPVALKRVLPELSMQVGFETMLVAEARIAARLVHPCIVQVLALCADKERGPFLVMERIDGRDLDSLLATGPLPHSLIIYILSTALRGLAFAHNWHEKTSKGGPAFIHLGIIHRDISPSNLLLSVLGEVKLNDFGLARAADATGRARSTTVRGKPAYMSPEQVLGEELDNRSDLWAFGVMLWEMLTHKPLFDGSTMEVMAWVRFKTIPRPSTIRSDVPADLEAIAMKLLERDLDKRYQCAEDVTTDLLHCDAATVNGQDELVATLGARFPEYAARVSSRSGPTGAALKARTPPPEQVTRPKAELVTRPAVLSTLGTAASESTPPHPLPRSAQSRRTLAWMALVPMIGAAVTFLAARAVRGHTGDPASSPVATMGPSTHPSQDDRTVVNAITLDGGSLSVAQSTWSTVDAASAIDAAPRPEASRSDMAQHDAGHLPAFQPDAALVAAIPPDAALVAAVPSAALVADAHQRDAEPPATRHPELPAPAVPPSSSPPAVAASSETGRLNIIVTPWAATVHINGKPAGETPFSRVLPAGSYAVQLDVDDLDKHVTVPVKILPNKTTELRRSW